MQSSEVQVSYYGQTQQNFTMICPETFYFFIQALAALATNVFHNIYISSPGRACNHHTRMHKRAHTHTHTRTRTRTHARTHAHTQVRKLIMIITAEIFSCSSSKLSTDMRSWRKYNSMEPRVDLYWRICCDLVSLSLENFCSDAWAQRFSVLSRRPCHNITENRTAIISWQSIIPARNSH